MEEEKKNSEIELSENTPVEQVEGLETTTTIEEPTEKTVETVETAEDLHGETLGDRVKVLSPGRMIAKRFFRSKLSVVGLVTLIFLFLFSFVGPLFSQWTGDDNMGKVLDTGVFTRVDQEIITYEVQVGDETMTYEAYRFSVREITNNTDADISSTHWLGTDKLGYDLFTRLMLGGRISLTIGFVVIIIETILGVILGGLSGYFGGWVDGLIMRIVDILSCIPSLPIMLVLAVVFDANGVDGIEKLYYMMGILSLMGWTGTARLVRGQILSLREQEFMLAAKCSGLSTGKKIFKHLLPNVLPQLIVSMTLGLGSIILTEATLGYLGLGAPLGSPTWGALILSVQDSATWNNWVPAGICITLAILAFNFVGDGLRDAFDPKMKR